jgi:large subunit ribosomal protein L6
MSRIGKKPIALPKGVTFAIDGNTVRVKGPKGEVTNHVPSGVTLAQEDGQLLVKRDAESFRAVHGLVRALVNNAVEGVTKGWTRELEIVGIGYRAELKGKGIVVFTLGYSHPIEYPLPTGIDVAIDPKQTKLTLTGIDRQKLGQVAAEMRSLRPPDPYKNKGVRYAGERLKKKVGKTGAK